LRPTATARQDPLWLAAAADAYEQLGQVDVAWQLRRLAWLAPAGGRSDARLVSDGARGAPHSGEARRLRELALQAERRRMALAPALSTGEETLARLQRLQRIDPTVRTGEGRDAVLGYAITRSLHEVAEAWLQQRYRASQERPGWGALSVALANDDRAQIASLLDSVPDWLPLADRVDAAARVQRRAQAQTLAFDGLAGRPDNALLHERLVNTTLAPLEAARGLDGTLAGFRQRPLDERSLALAGTAPLGQRLWLRAALGSIDRRTTDPALLLDPPTERNAALTVGALGAADSVRLRWTLGVQQRTALATETGVLGTVQWRATPRLDLSGAVGLAQPATDNAVLRAGGQRDLVEAAAEWRPSLREFIVLGGSRSRLQAQGGGGDVGDASTLRAEFGHRIRLEYPDLTVRLTYANLRYRAREGVAEPLLALVPEDLRPFTTNASLLPQSTEQWALRASCGDSVVTTYTRGWRLFCAAALTRDAQAGTGNEWLIGARGSVLGSDQLLIGVGGGTSLGATRLPYTEITINYRSFF
jgi:hypothetical protein